MIENMRYAMKRISRIIVFALLVAVLIGCSNNPNSGNSGIILPGGPGFPVSNPFKDDAIEITGTVIDSLDHQTIFNEFREAVKRLFDSTIPDIEGIGHGPIYAKIDGILDEKQPLTNDAMSALLSTLLGSLTGTENESVDSYVAQALNKVIIAKTPGEVIAESEVTFDGYSSGLKGEIVSEITSGSVNVVVSPRVMLLEYKTADNGGTIIGINVLGDYSMSSISGAPIKVTMADGAVYDFSFDTISGLFTASADLVGEGLKGLMNGGSITEAIDNTAGRLYLPSSDETTKITVSGEGDSASFAWKELAASNFGSKNAIGPSADILESADILPFMTGFGSVRLINSLDRAMTANDGTDSETDTGTLKIKNYDKLAVEGNALVFELELADYAYSTVVSEDATMSSLTITATGPQKKATGTATLTFTGSFDPERQKFTANGYKLDSDSIAISSDPATVDMGGTPKISADGPSGNLSIDVSGGFDGKTVEFTLEGNEKGIKDANDHREDNPTHNTAFAGLFENITSMNVSGSVTADFESLSKVLELLG